MLSVVEPSTQGPTLAIGASETAGQRLERLVARYQDRLNYLFRSFRFWHARFRGVLSFNESLKAGARSLNPRAKSKPPRARVDPELELLINVRASELAVERQSNSEQPCQCDINAASAEVIARFKPRLGRPPNRLLEYHVHAFMALHRQTCGEELRAGTTRNGSYDPRIKSPIQDRMLEWFRSIDPSVTIATLADIVDTAQRSGDVEGKQFEDFFPFFGGSVGGVTGDPMPGPGFRLERFVRVAPIYSS